MNICAISKKGILYEENTSKGSLLAIYAPTEEQKRQYADMSSPSKGVIRDRYGMLAGEPLYRTEHGVVTVYGQLPRELYELRNEVNVYLPEDLVSLDTSVLYYVIGENLIIHSVRHIESDGTVNWSSVVIQLEKKGAGVLNVVENLIAERIVSSDDEKILVAYTGLNDELRESLYQRLNQFGVVIEPIEKLTGHKNKTPIYRHKDNTILMLVCIIIAVILFVLSLIYFISGEAKLGKSNEKIEDLKKEFKESLSKRRLKQVSNPQAVKDSIEKAFRARPSAIIHAAAEVAKSFGVLDTIYLEKRMINKDTKEVENVPESDVVYVIATVKSPIKDLLIDQERIANAIYEDKKWIRSIERDNKNNSEMLTLKIGIYVGNEGGV